jgi:hypothetical protein
MKAACQAGVGSYAPPQPGPRPQGGERAPYCLAAGRLSQQHSLDSVSE